MTCLFVCTMHLYECVMVYSVCVLATDLYTFDADATSAEATFIEVCDSYVRIFSRLGLPFAQGIAILWCRISLIIWWL